jgi:hypothetical protein
MSISKCVVRLKDSHDTEHSVVVYAETLYEAVLLGLNRLSDVGGNPTAKRLNGWKWRFIKSRPYTS